MAVSELWGGGGWGSRQNVRMRTLWECIVAAGHPVWRNCMAAGAPFLLALLPSPLAQVPPKESANQVMCYPTATWRCRCAWCVVWAWGAAAAPTVVLHGVPCRCCAVSMRQAACVDLLQVGACCMPGGSPPANALIDTAPRPLLLCAPHAAGARREVQRRERLLTCPAAGDERRLHQTQYATWLGLLEGAKLPDGIELKPAKCTVADVQRVEVTEAV